MVTQQSATDGVSAGLDTRGVLCFYWWPVAMQCLSHGERKTEACLNKHPQAQLFNWELNVVSLIEQRSAGWTVCGTGRLFKE